MADKKKLCEQYKATEIFQPMNFILNKYLTSQAV